MRPARKVLGFGVNDADYALHKYEVVSGKRKCVWVCPIYRAWRGMIERCYSDSFHKVQPSYKGCTVCQEWAFFSVFRAWAKDRIGEGMHLDKDIIIPGNKTYSPSTCCFVSKKVNSFITDCRSARGELPAGVTKGNGRGFEARCRNPFTGAREHLGTFESPEAAHLAWRARKHELATDLADHVSCKKAAKALMSRYS